MDKKVELVGDKRVLKIFCNDCNGPGNLLDPQCRECVARTLTSLDSDVDLVSLIKEFRRVYPSDQLRLLVELVNLENKLKNIDVQFKYIPRAGYYLSEIKRNVLRDPIRAYTIAKEQSLIEVPQSFEKKREYTSYKKLMKSIASALENTKIVSLAIANKSLDKSFYAKMFHPWAIPSFVTSHIAPISPSFKPLDSYFVGKTQVSIYKLPDRSEYFYVINPPEFLLHADESKAIVKTLDEISRREPELVDPTRARDYFKKLSRDLIQKYLPGLSPERLDELSDIAARYSAGYGLLEVLLADEHLQDIYVDSPGNNFVYVYHDKYEDCITNLLLSKSDLERIAARLRALSGRPFDESAPVLHTEIPEYRIRVAGLHPPATFDGIGFAFRRGRPKPWTLPQFIRVGMLSPEVAGLISFLVEGESTMLITGARGSGKTSLLSSILGEIDPRYRIIVIEDTPELPVEQLKKVGYKIQHVRVRAAIGGNDEESSYELSADAALRTALRLGESVLVLGEVRGPEARALFEAMRVGAAGNVVLGTIHGSSAYDTWDRIVNDLGVPTTSFKATDIVISTAAIRRSGETVRKRRVMAVTEVRKEWREDPYHEGGFFDLVKYDSYEDRWVMADLKESESLKKIAELKGMKFKDVLANIEVRGEAKKLLVDRAKELGRLELLEVEHVAKFNSELNRAISEELVKGKLDKKRVLSKIEKFIEGYL